MAKTAKTTKIPSKEKTTIMTMFMLICGNFEKRHLCCKLAAGRVVGGGRQGRRHKEGICQVTIKTTDENGGIVGKRQTLF